MKYPRSSCVIPGCRRWSTRFEGEWICGEHWRLVPMRLKRLRTRIMKRRRRVWETANARTLHAQHCAAWGGPVDDIWREGHHAANALSAYWRAESAIWSRMKRAALERAAGL